MLEKAHPTVEQELKDYLKELGDCVVVVAADDIVKVHVHTNDPGLAIQKALTYGALTSMKIDNMREEHQEKVIRDSENVAAQQAAASDAALNGQPRKEFGFIAVSVGDGLRDIFKDLGVDALIEGGQTMNPSTEDILEAIQKVNADQIFVFPNNGNIILAAQQAAELTEDKKVIVVPSKNIPQGITAMINFVANRSAEENLEQMMSEMENIKSGQVTYAVRDTKMDGLDIHKGHFMGLTDKTIVATDKSLKKTTLKLLEAMLDDASELVSIYYGDQVKEEDAKKIAKELEKIHPDIEVEIQMGGQPVYSYFVSVE